ncbi:SDR family oxidoreductase [Micromonospora ureilytica]|uniref:SDR family NAD(P)-dependent oxidoreductase n=1 Tax=Micromonospora ureilytica TaxID=709868 RepID=UPI0033FE1D46
MTTPHAATTQQAVLITGGGGGIGRAAAHAFAEAGAGVLVVGRTESSLIETAKDHETIRVLAADITDTDAPELIVDAALREFGRLDVLVNNAAALGFGTLPGLDIGQATTQLNTNLLAPIRLTAHAVPALEAAHGTVVNISSAGSLGSRSWPGNGVYGAAKVALDFLTRTWAVELAPRGIRVVALAPGVTDTDFGPRAGMTDEQYQGLLRQMAAQAPAGRVGTPEEVAWWITQLVRPEAGYVTGTVLAVDGGLSLT